MNSFNGILCNGRDGVDIGQNLLINISSLFKVGKRRCHFALLINKRVGEEREELGNLLYLVEMTRLVELEMRDGCGAKDLIVTRTIS